MDIPLKENYGPSKKKYHFFGIYYHTLLFVHTRVRNICTFD